MQTSCFWLRASLVLGFMVALSTGCDAAVPLDNPQNIEPPALTRQVPLHFKRHNFEALCYNTIGCTVVYNGHYQVHEAEDEISPPKPAGIGRKAWGSTELDIRNFPKPAEVRWKSKDGVAHVASIDIGQIFKDELIWHNLRKEEMADFYAGPVAGSPDIYLEVDNRTISVYTAMSVPTRDEQIPGNKDSNFRKDIFLVWSRTY
ncbi:MULTISPECIES: hypothetical protein [unclassified Variovorax]|jgi:hypothetical protein|uniref:hypothetical protein n=1 Tax=unclassified Variovorax TaxID=663243 RepID=UPI000F7E7739|nr:MULTISPECIES: hypothetical protein [unclassified Variovorax]RSZ32763.1 hypothetical protein EJO70_29870 [Variovorax sp. 553]RSZ33001.1 hypothetical protein EJO71_29215 [Variovorax sp. 679]